MTEIRVVMDALEGVTEQVIKKLALDVVANLVRAPQEGGTPVDTGWARANWLASVGTPIEEPVGTPGAEGVPAAESQQAQGQGTVAGYRLPMGSVYISNNVPYILRLNDGSSKQAPAGFVQRAIQDAVTQLRTVA